MRLTSGLATTRRAAMEHYVGLDVSLKLTAICIVDRTRKIEREGVVASDPETIAAFVKLHAPNSRLYETRSPRWPSQGSRLSILTEPHDELAGPHSITLSALFAERQLWNIGPNYRITPA